jgi:hypothetical protein
MLYPRDRIPDFRERHPRVASVLYQIGLCVTTFSLAITIDRTMEKVCPNIAREDEFKLGILDVYLCRVLDVCLCAVNCARMILTRGTKVAVKSIARLVDRA